MVLPFRIHVAAVLLLFSISPILFCQQDSASADTAVGTLDYYDGRVDVYRDGEYVPWRQIMLGMEMEKFDLLQTGDAGLAEVGLNRGIRSEAVIRVMENSAFYFDFDKQFEKQRAECRLLTGAIGLKVKKFTGDEELLVRTESGVFGVRGTEFNVITAPDGGVLVTCKEGLVSCTNERGDRIEASPGVVVEQGKSSLFQAINVDVADLEKFERSWIDHKINSFIANSLGAVKTYSKKYLDYRDTFLHSYANLMEYNDIFRRWEEGNGEDVSSTVKDKIAVSTAVFRLRSILFMFEQSFYRIWGLVPFYENNQIRKGMLWSGYNTDDFFEDFKRQQHTIAWKMSQVRHVFNLYAKMSWDISPRDELMEDIFSGENPLQDSNFFDSF